MIFGNNFLKALAVFFLFGLLSSCDRPSMEDQGKGLIEVTIEYNEAGDPRHPDTGPFIFTPYTVDVERRAKNVPIRLKIISGGFTFSGDVSEAFTVSPIDWNILPQNVGPDGTTIMIIDKNRVEKEYKYGVVIIREIDGERFVIDPRIKNGGGAVY